MKLLSVVFLVATSLIVLNVSSASTTYPINVVVKNNHVFYTEAGMSYNYTITSGQHNSISIQPVQGAPFYAISYHNNKPGDAIGIFEGAGYQWRLSPTWSWSLGGRLSYHSLEQKGAYTSGPKTTYGYDINALVMNAVLRVAWDLSPRNTFYIEIAGGIANLRSQNFHLTADSLYMIHRNKTVNNFDYELGLGWLYAITKQMDFSVAIGYQDLGKAALGRRYVPSGAVSKGEVNQGLQGVNARIGLVYWF